jgi:hypothetical protein
MRETASFEALSALPITVILTLPPGWSGSTST